MVIMCHTRGEYEESIAFRQESTHARDPPWLWNPGQTSPKVQNRDNSGPTEIIYALQKNLKN